MQDWNRREFLKTSAFGLAVTATGGLGWPSSPSAKVSLVRATASTREAAIREAIELVGPPDATGKWFALKPNFNSAHAFPGSTHPDTLRVLVQLLHEWRADRITVADRSGMGNSRAVMQEKGVFDLAEQLQFEALPLEDLPAAEWVSIAHGDLHWSRGFQLGRIFRQVDGIVQTCCLKTHRFGGHFTLSLKNSVGMVAKRVPGVGHDFMRELHGSRHQRRMIAELNLSYEPDLVVMDAIEAFTDRGPESGPLAPTHAVLASTDRVAIDAVGVAMLRQAGTNEDVSQGSIFDLDQIARAVELGIGVDTPDSIEIVTADPASATYAEQLREILVA